MTEEIKIWQPMECLGGQYWFKNSLLINGQFIFIFEKNKSEDLEARIICDGGLPSYKYTNESYTFDRGFIHVEGEEKMQAVRPWCFYTVENSSYLKSISKDSGGLSDMLGFKHYCIISGDEIIDIIYPPEPIVEFYKNEMLIQSSKT